MDKPQITTGSCGADQGRASPKRSVNELQGFVVTGVADQSHGQGSLVGWKVVLWGQAAACVTSCVTIARALSLSVPQFPYGVV